MILAIDPGTTQSGWCLLDNFGKIHGFGISRNFEMRLKVKDAKYDELAIEMIAGMGMPVGQEVFETCVWIGRFTEAWHDPDEVKYVYRKDVKLHLCGSLKATDSTIRCALIDKFGKPGTKKKPGPTYGIIGDAWQAVAVAVTARETLFAPIKHVATVDDLF